MSLFSLYSAVSVIDKHLKATVEFPAAAVYQVKSLLSRSTVHCSLMPVTTELILIPLSCAKKNTSSWFTKEEDLLPPVMYSAVQGYAKYSIPQIGQCGRCVHTCMAAWLVTHATGHCILLHTHKTYLAVNHFIKGVHPAASQTGILSPV